MAAIGLYIWILSQQGWHYLKGLGGVAFLEEVSLEAGFKVQKPKPDPSVSLFLLLVDPDVELLSYLSSTKSAWEIPVLPAMKRMC